MAVSIKEDSHEKEDLRGQKKKKKKSIQCM